MTTKEARLTKQKEAELRERAGGYSRINGKLIRRRRTRRRVI
jgi:hypothetical protein